MWSKKELIDKQAQFWVLMARGSTLTAACDAVGVNRRTGCQRQPNLGRVAGGSFTPRLPQNRA